MNLHESPQSSGIPHIRRLLPHVPSWVWEGKERILRAGLEEAERSEDARHVVSLRFCDNNILVDLAPPEVPLEPDWGELIYDLGNQLETLWFWDDRIDYTPLPLAVVKSAPGCADIAVMATQGIYWFCVDIAGSVPAGGTWESIRDRISARPERRVWPSC